MKSKKYNEFSELRNSFILLLSDRMLTKKQIFEKLNLKDYQDFTFFGMIHRNEIIECGKNTSNEILYTANIIRNY